MANALEVLTIKCCLGPKLGPIESLVNESVFKFILLAEPPCREHAKFTKCVWTPSQVSQRPAEAGGRNYYASSTDDTTTAHKVSGRVIVVTILKARFPIFPPF